MKKRFLIVIILIIILVLIVLVLRIFSGDEDTWLCQNGEWIKHGHPSAPMPGKSCGEKSAVVFTTEKGNSDIIKVESPLPDSAVSSPLEIKGEARGTWYFEAGFPVKLFDSAGNLMATGIAQAQSDWMTENFVPFKAELNFSQSGAAKGILVLEKDNPSGLAENADELRIPVNFEMKAETMVLKIYFNNNKLDPEISCNKVFPVEREILKTPATAKAALEELLKGPTESEKTKGFSTSINSGVKIQKLAIENGVAKVDFDEQLEFQAGGSCRVSAIRSEIVQTLKQFQSVNEVIISINGRTEDILQP